MSEYQYVAFRAIDRPLDEKGLEFMQRQSSRAEITEWSFDNEYNFGDFRGNAAEMLRRGFDLHMHYADFGIHKLLIRFPDGLPESTVVSPFLIEEALEYVKDKAGPGGTLGIEPFYEPGDIESQFDPAEMADRLIPLRQELLDGDVRPLYLAHLAAACDCNHDPDVTKEAPVPAGLNKLSDAQQALVEFYGLSAALVAAAARECPALQKPPDVQESHSAWLRGQPEALKDAWLSQLLADSRSTSRREILAKYRASRNMPPWPTVIRGRTISELQEAAEEIRHDRDCKEAAAADRRRAKRLVDMAADPARIIKEIEKLVEQRSRTAYCEISKLLADLREALRHTRQSGLAENHAEQLRTNFPTLRVLISELRKEGLLRK